MLHALFPEVKQTRDAAVQSLRASLREITTKIISPTKREILTAVFTYLINRIQNDSIAKLAMTDYDARRQQILSIAQSTHKNDDGFIQDVWRMINSLPEGSALKTNLEQAVNRAQATLDARRSSAYQLVTGATIGVTALLILSEPRIGLPLLVLDLATAFYPAPVKHAFNNLLELFDAILSTNYESAGNQQRAQVPALR